MKAQQPAPPGNLRNRDVIAAIPSCALDQAGRLQQYARYERLATSVRRIERKPDSVVVRFGEPFDRALLERTLAVERQCCPFFRFQLEESGRRLEIGVRRADQLPALETLAAAFAAVQSARATSERDP